MRLYSPVHWNADAHTLTHTHTGRHTRAHTQTQSGHQAVVNVDGCSHYSVFVFARMASSYGWTFKAVSNPFD